MKVYRNHLPGEIRVWSVRLVREWSDRALGIVDNPVFDLYAFIREEAGEYSGGSC